MATKYENYITGDDGAAGAWSTTWRAQTFTPSTAHVITSVKLLLYKIGSPETVTVSIKATDDNGKPTGDDLCSGTTDGDTLPTGAPYEWREITLGSGYVLMASTKYAIVVRAVGDNANDAVAWRLDSSSPSYTGGSDAYSQDTGSSWTLATANDLMFEDWGDPLEWTAPSVTTQAVSSIDKTTATGNGNVTSLGTPPATQHGHCWATYPNPTIAQPTTHTTTGGRTENGVPSATGAFTSSLTTLRPNTQYYVRAYVTNSVRTIYGAQAVFTTLADVPVVTTGLATGVAVTTAQGNGSIDNNGGSAVTQHGVCWDTSANPTTSDSKTEEGITSVIGDFSSLMTGLTAETTYHYRAYATNASGTGYGADKTFTTHAIGAPIVTTQKTTSVQPDSATGHGTIVDVGGAAVTQHGHVWASTENPTTSDDKTEKDAGSAGAFESAITGLTAGTAYYIRAYATNSFGTSYGDHDIINQVAGELIGNLATLAEWLVYTDKFGTQRALLGDKF